MIDNKDNTDEYKDTAAIVYNYSVIIPWQERVLTKQLSKPLCRQEDHSEFQREF